MPLRGLKIIADTYAVNVIDAVNKANAWRVDAQEALKLVDEANATIQREWKACMATFLTPEEARLAQQAQALFGAADRDIERVQAALQAITGPAQGRLEAFDGPLYDSIDRISAKIAELIDLQLRVAKEVYDAAEQRFSLILWLTVVLVAAAVLASAALAAEVRTLAQRSAGAAKEIKDLITASVERVETGSQQVAEAGASVREIVEQVQRVTDLINEITTASDEQASGIRQVAQATQDLDQVTQQNAALAEQSNATAENLRAQARSLSAEVSRFKVDATDMPTPLRRLDPQGTEVRVAARPRLAPVAAQKLVEPPVKPRTPALGQRLGPRQGAAASATPARLPSRPSAPRDGEDAEGQWTSF